MRQKSVFVQQKILLSFIQWRCDQRQTNPICNHSMVLAYLQYIFPYEITTSLLHNSFSKHFSNTLLEFPVYLDFQIVSWGHGHDSIIPIETYLNYNHYILSVDTVRKSLQLNWVGLAWAVIPHHTLLFPSFADSGRQGCHCKVVCKENYVCPWADTKKLTHATSTTKVLKSGRKKTCFHLHFRWTHKFLCGWCHAAVVFVADDESCLTRSKSNRTF